MNNTHPSEDLLIDLICVIDPVLEPLNRPVVKECFAFFDNVPDMIAHIEERLQHYLKAYLSRNTYNFYANPKTGTLNLPMAFKDCPKLLLVAVEELEAALKMPNSKEWVIPQAGLLHMLDAFLCDTGELMAEALEQHHHYKPYL